jgi:hypothetical protein
MIAEIISSDAWYCGSSRVRRPVSSARIARIGLAVSVTLVRVSVLITRA